MNMTLAGQMSIFDLIENNNKSESLISWDNDINEIVNRLRAIAKEYGLPVQSEEWGIWEHVPNLGYRLTFNITVKRDTITEKFSDSINAVIDFAETKEIALSPIPPHFFASSETASFRIYSMFKDKERQRKKSCPA